MKARFDILCASGEACPSVKNELVKIGFADKDIKETPKSFTRDMTAVIALNGETEEYEEIEQIKKKIFESCKEQISHVYIEAA